FGLLITLIRLVFIGFIVLIAISFSLAILITTLLVSSALVAVAIIIAPVSFILFGSLCVTLGLFTRALLIITLLVSLSFRSFFFCPLLWLFSWLIVGAV